MKRCPTCGLTLDDSQTFCTNDGTPLVADKSSYDPQATMIIPPSAVPTAQPPPPQPPPPAPMPQAPQTGWQQPARPTSPPAPAYGAQPLSYGQPPALQGAQPGKFVPALIGGAITGILSLFAGFMDTNAFVILSFFCIVWALIGGAVAANLYVKRSPTPVRSGEGAVVGLIAGAIAALIYLALDTPVAYSIHADTIEFLSSQQKDRISAGAFFAVSGIFGAATIAGFSVLGGLIGVAMFEKRKGMVHTSMPPPPPGYGQPPYR
ncbi:MAG TPA: hypothetical protein VN256_12705 [Pyrinomonadaceae bacterium]|nr:hypothetical protein [Pyrinomonadaceae bacterium]